MLFDTPDWAARHNYFHHSNPRRPRAKQIYEKAHVRPQIDAAWETIKDDEATDKDKKVARSIITRLRDGRSNARMEAGTAVQIACDLHLVKDEFEQTLSLPEAIAEATRELRQYTPQSWNDTVRENDTALLDKCLEELPDVIENAVIGLREAMRLDNRITREVDLKGLLPGNALPHFTKPDYNRCGDLKTKWSRLNSRAKSGWQSAGLPKTLTGMFDMNNVYQVAGFWALNGHRPPWLLYANATDYRLFDQNNTPELRDDYLHDVVADMALQHKTTENILRAASNKEELLGLVAPDWTAIHWNEPPTYLDEAKKMWGVNQ